jgi:diketogulonate reductase-like aldo/keto reductase
VENIDVFDIDLDAEDVEAISSLSRGHRTGPHPDDVKP